MTPSAPQTIRPVDRFDPLEAARATPAEARQRYREGLVAPTTGRAAGFTQANMVMLPQDWAFDMLLFGQRNPQPVPLLDVTDPGATASRLAPGADLRTDLPRYRVWRDGELVDEPTDAGEHWPEDLVAFLIGCSFTFERALQAEGLPIRHVEQGVNVPMYRTAIDCTPAGRFSGPLVVSMRPMRPDQAIRATQITSRYGPVHGGPVHVGAPGAIGIEDLAAPDYGDAVEVRDGELPVFWACGVTPQAVAVASRPELMITHAPGHMFVTDLRDETMAPL